MQALKAKCPGKGFTIPLMAAQRALALPFKKLNFRKGWSNQTKCNLTSIGKTTACRDTGGRVDQPA
jgi:hypothetical protein